ncbi:MAG TPA: LysR family transcriptional regulator [Polyangiales bacterium]
MLNSIGDIRVFVQVVGSNGLSAAGRVLGIPANTVSRTLTRLEDDLGVRLLQRTTRSLSLTEEGRAFHEQALQLLASVDEAESVVRRRSSGLSGLVRVAVRTTTVQFDLVPELTTLLEAHPTLRVQLVVTDDEIDLVSAGLDLALRVGALADSHLASRHLGDVAFVLAATGGYLKQHGTPKRPADLTAHECVRALGARPQTTWTLEAKGKKHVEARVGGRFECNDVRAQAAAIYAGFGIGLRPAGEVRRAVREGTLVHVLPEWQLAPIPVRVLLPPRGTGGARAAATREVIALLRKVVARMS